MLYSLSFIGLLAIILGGAYAVKKFLDNRQVKVALQSPITIEASSKYVNIVESQWFNLSLNLLNKNIIIY
mgnify:CR=1 FL=1